VLAPHTKKVPASTQMVLPANARIHATSSVPFMMTLGTKSARARLGFANSWIAEAALNSAGQLEQLSLDLETGPTPPLALDLSYATDADPTLRPLPFNASLLPWAPAHHPPPTSTGGKPELAGGDYERGRSLFYGERLKCSTCHRLRNQGNVIGPDLSNLTQRDAASVLRDLKEPNASINPDYVAYNVTLHDGRELTGFVRAQDAESLRLISADGKENIFHRAEVKELRASSVSLMPTGLIDTLKEEQVRDLLTFLLSEPPKRTRVEVEAVLEGPSSTASLDPTSNGSQPKNSGNTAERVPRVGKQKLHIVLIASKQDHGPGQHDYPAWQKKWHSLLGRAPGVTVIDAWLWPTPEQFEQADLLVFYFWNHDWSAERYQQLDAYLEQGGGIVLLHSATIADKDPEQLAARIGLAAQPGPTKYLHCPLDLKIVAAADHPITHGLKQIDFLQLPPPRPAREAQAFEISDRRGSTSNGQ
jgi:putative heme-binding domain-containing protein